jgi:hypothetical protein
VQAHGDAARTGGAGRFASERDGGELGLEGTGYGIFRGSLRGGRHDVELA